MASMRLHANLLFYGLDEGTWSDPPPGPRGGGGFGTGVDRSGGAGWPQTKSSPWGLRDPGDTQATWGGFHGTEHPAEPSTDEGSEPKGSESDSLPELNEGCLAVSSGVAFGGALLSTGGGCSGPASVPSPAPASTPLSYMPPASATVTSHPTAPADAATPYQPYLPSGAFLSAHGFGGAAGGVSEAAHFPYVDTLAIGVGAEPGLAEAPGPGSNGVPSIGSYAHLSGQCSRCCFHPKGRCANGYSCQFCHFDHDKRPRNGKKKRYRRQPDGTLIEGPDMD